MSTIIKQDFDSEIFETPYYRIKNFNFEQVKKELSIIKKSDGIIIDAKINSYEKEWDIFLQKNGFRKICMQVELTKTPSLHKENNSVLISNDCSFPDKIIKKHVENFKFDRFSLDSRINQEKRSLLYFSWIKNSFKSRDVYLAINGYNFCSFKISKDEASIDLTSVLEQRKNIGSKLLNAIDNFLIKKKVKKIKVVTECENLYAYNFYKKNKFSTSNFISCFHLFG